MNFFFFPTTFSLPSTEHVYLLLAGLKCNVVILGAGNCPSMQQDFLTKESQMWAKNLQNYFWWIYFLRQAEKNTWLLYVIHEVVTSDVCIHPERERQRTCLFVRGSVRSVLYIQLWRDVRTPEMRKPFYCFTVAFVGRLRKPLSHTNRTLEGPNLFCLGLSLGFCVMDKSTFLHTHTPCKSKHGVQLWVCYQFTEFRDDARAVFLSSVVQNMDKQAERGWKLEVEDSVSSVQIKQVCTTGWVEISLHSKLCLRASQKRPNKQNAHYAELQVSE